MRLSPLLVLLAACSTQPQQLTPLSPERLLTEGDVAVFGPGPVAVDDLLREVEFRLNTSATVVIYTFDHRYTLRVADRRRLTAGTHRIMTRRADSQNTSTLRGEWDALLFIAADENDWRTAGTSTTIPPNEALVRLAPSLMRHGSSRWAAYLVAP